VADQARAGEERIIGEVRRDEARGDRGAQRGCARTGGQGSTEGRSAAAPVQGGAGQQARRGAARLRPYRGAARGKRREGDEAWFMKGVVNVPSANTTRGRDS
jgi:hypothetical protein